MIPFRLPPKNGNELLLRSYLRTLVSDLNEAVSALGKNQEKLTSEALLPADLSSLPSLPAGIGAEDETAFAVRMGKNVLLTAGNHLFLGTSDGENLRWTEK